MTILTTLPNGGNLSTDGLTTHCHKGNELLFGTSMLSPCVAYNPLGRGCQMGAFSIWRTEPKRLAFGETTETIFAECFQAVSCKLDGKYATKEPGIRVLKSGLPYTPIRLERVATVHNVGRGAYHSTEWYIRNLLRWGRWLVWGAMREIQKDVTK